MPERITHTNSHRRTECRVARRALVSRAVSAVLAVTVFAGSLTLAPAAALASKLSSDRVGGIKLSTGVIPKTSAPDITAKAGVIVADGRVLWSRNSESRRAMASTTKVMTALLVLEKGNLNKKVKITRTAARTPYATGLHAGEKLTVRKLLELSLVSSSNDAATALAIHTGGSVGNFTKMMNARAKRLGLTDTRFKNPHGLDTKGHYSSPADLTKLMAAAMNHSEFKRIVKLKTVTLPKHGKRKARKLKSTDKLLGAVKGLQGGKTGFTGDARYCFVSSARRDGVTLTAAVLGSSSSSARFTSSKRLLDWGFKNYKITRVCSEGDFAGTVPVSSESTDTANAANTASTVTATLATTTQLPVFRLMGPVSMQAELPASVPASVRKGQKLGVVRFVQGSQVIATVDAIAAETIETIPATP